MKTSLKWKLIASLAVVSSLFVFTGCKLGETLDDVKEKYNLSAQVTYYANGGVFEQTKSVKNLYYKAGSTAINIKDDNSIANISLARSGYDFLDWYYIERDADGEPMFEDEAQTIPVKSEIKADFSDPLEENEHWILVADWAIQARVKIQLVCDDLAEGETIALKSGNSVKEGELIREYLYEGTTLKRPDEYFFKPDDDCNFTFVQFYKNEACGSSDLMTDADWPLQRTEEDVYLYAKYIKGEWKILQTASDVKNMFGSNGKMYSSNMHYYQIADIDCADVTIAPIENFGCEWQGNRVL